MSEKRISAKELLRVLKQAPRGVRILVYEDEHVQKLVSVEELIAGLEKSTDDVIVVDGGTFSN